MIGQGILVNGQHRLAAGLLSVIVLLVFSFPLVRAQNGGCASVISREQYEHEMARMKAGQAFVPPAVVLPYHLPVTLHICRRSDGTGGVTAAQLDSAMIYLNRGLNAVGFQFFQYGGIIEIDNDGFFTVLDSATRAQLRQQVSVPNTINVYFTHLDPTICGESSFPADAIHGIVMDSACAGSSDNPTSFAHEVGHYLDLYHTHETEFGVECPDGSNCGSAGDLACDTPADPNVSDSVNASCVYIGNAVPPGGCGPTPYNPPVFNLMSYSRKTCRTNVTPDQVNRMMATMGTTRANLHTHVKYVDRDWPGNENGTPQEPFRTVQGALGAASFGDFIFVRSGNYPEVFSTANNTNARIDRWDIFGTVIIGQ